MQSLTAQLHAAKNGLEDANIALCGVVTAHAEAKRALEHAEAVLVCKGLEGKNEKERAAALTLSLAAERHTLQSHEDALTEAQCGLELARLEWDLVRYKLRLLELSPAETA